MSKMDDRLNREGDKFADSPVGSSIKWGTIIIVVVCILIAVGVVGKFALGWFSGAASVVGFDNTSRQYRQVLGDYNSLEAQARNLCVFDEKAANERGATFTETPKFALEATYNNTAAHYDRLVENPFEAGLVGPGGLPPEAPTLKEMEAAVC